MATWCPDLSGDLAVNLVGDAHTVFMNRGRQTYDTAIESLQQLGDIELAPYEYQVSFNFDGQLAPFRRPTRPDLDEASFAPAMPGAPGTAPGFVGTELTFTTAPDLGIEAPTLTFGAQPAKPIVALPIAPPPPGELVLPVTPEYVLPPVPTFEQLNLPSVPEIAIPQFDGERPVWVDPPFNETWHFEATAYESVLLDRLVSTLDPMLKAAEALPSHIEAAIFQRDRSRIEIETERSVEASVADFANRGFSAPPGMLSGRVLQIRQTGLAARAEASRDVAIRQFEATLENLRFAVVQGAALEGVFVGLHQAEQQTALQAAMFQRDSAIAVLNARITVFNARQQAYQVDAQVLGERIRASLAHVELYRAQIEGELAKGQVNEQRVRLYEGLLRGVDLMATFYRNQVEAVRVQSDVDRNQVERYKAQVDAYDSRWRAHVAEWQGYIASVEGEGKRADVYRTMVDANAKRVDAWRDGNTMQIEAERLRIAQHGAQLQAWEGGMRRYLGELEAVRTHLSAAASKADATARMYTADASVEQAASAATDRSFELGLARARALVDAQLRDAEMRIAQAKGLIDQAISIRDAQARVGSQLAASTMSAVGYSASVGSSRSRSNSCSSNFSFAGEIADAGI